MADGGSSVTLIFYKIGSEWWKEPALNLIAAAAQMSSYCHVEIGIGEHVGSGGQIANVARIFNDAVAYTYLSLGCSKAAELRMLAYARSQVGKPFSNSGMARSLFWPRTTDGRSFFCAELVASVLKVGGLMSGDSNAGAATPTSLYKMYSKGGAVAANPYTLRAINSQTGGLSFSTIGRLPGTASEKKPILSVARSAPSGSARRSDSPPRASFKVLSAGAPVSKPGSSSQGLTLTLNSLR